MTLASLLVATAAGMIGLLGLAHLVITFSGRRLEPHDATLLDELRHARLRITRETTFWKAWVGFNASHSLGALLFAAVFLHLSLFDPAGLHAFSFLLSCGSVALLAWLALAARYWFRIPLAGILLANASWFAGLLLLFTQ